MNHFRPKGPMLSALMLAGSLLIASFGSGAGTAAFAAEPARPAAAPNAAGIPRAFAYQGVLRLADGSLANGTFNVTLRIYTAVSGGAALHTEVFSNTVARNGNFSVVVGDSTPISATLFDNPALYLGITVAPDAELLPRQRLVPVPWALQSTTALTSTTLVKNATITGLVINKGATNEPALTLTSSGAGLGSGLQLVNLAGNVTYGEYVGSDGAWNLTNQGGGQLLMHVPNGGSVNIDQNLVVNGAASTSGAATIGGPLTVNGGYALIQGYVSTGKVFASQGFNGTCVQGAFNQGVVGNNLNVTCNQDVAETFATDQRTEAGDVVVFSPTDRSTPSVRLSSAANGGGMVGVVSTNPGLLFDQGTTKLAGPNDNLITDKKTVVAMIGRVPVKFSAENGPIAIGDPLTSGSIPGTAMKATQAGQIIGYAMQSSAAAKDGKLLVWLQLGAYVPKEALAALNSAAELKAQVAVLAAQVAALQAAQR